MVKTDNHSLDKPEAGSTDWHIPLNTNFEVIDTEMVIAGPLNERPEPGDEGRKFLAIDQKLWYYDNGTNWEVESVVIEPRSTDPTSPVKGQQWLDNSGKIKYYDGSKTRLLCGWTY